MRWCLFLLLPAVLPAQSTLQPSASNTTARLEGQVLSKAGEPLRKANVWLRPNGSSRPNSAVYSDTTDANGNFVFEAVIPGSYNLSVERTGFLMQNYGARGAFNMGPGTVLTLAPGQALKDLTFKLSPQGVITGRVVDSDGDPLQGIQVRVMKRVRTRGQGRLSFTSGAGTNDQGEFRIANLSPGTYYAVADNQNSRMFGTENIQRSRTPVRQTNVPTYYPSGLDLSSATAVEVTPGSEIRGIEIQMRSEVVYSIRGVVTDGATGKPVAANLNARPKVNPEFGVGMGATNSNEDGSFELRNLLPGAYLIAVASLNGLPGNAVEEITITDSDIIGLKLALAHGVPLAGTIKIEGADLKTPANNLLRSTIMLLPTDGSIRAPSTQPKEDGTFELRDVVPGKYAVSLLNMPDGMYLKSVRTSGQDATRTMLDLTSGVSGTLDILLSPHGAEISGTVKTDDGDALPGVQVTVWPKEVRPDEFIGGNLFMTDQNGNFHAKGFAPGDYFVAAWEELEEGDDIDFLRRFTSQAVAITLQEGAHQTAQPKLISREAAAAEAAKLP